MLAQLILAVSLVAPNSKEPLPAFQESLVLVRYDGTVAQKLTINCLPEGKQRLECTGDRIDVAQRRDGSCYVTSLPFSEKLDRITPGVWRNTRTLPWCDTNVLLITELHFDEATQGWVWSVRWVDTTPDKSCKEIAGWPAITASEAQAKGPGSVACSRVTFNHLEEGKKAAP